MFCWIWSLERGSFKDPIIILMDSGGGSYMHISVATALLCDRYNAHPFVLPAYCTKALMPLDMTPHAVMSKKWAEFKRAWARQDSTLSIWSALAALRRIVDEGLSAVNARAGWSHVGLQPGSGFLRDKVLVDRFDEIFASKRAGGGNLQEPKSQAAGALDLLKIVSPKKNRCQNGQCIAQVPETAKFCHECGAENRDYDVSVADLHKPGRKAGWRKPVENVSATPETKGETELAAGVGDLLTTLRKRKPKMTEDGPAETDTPLQPTKKTKVCEPSVPAVAPEAATSLPSALPPVADSDEEHNLNTVAGCTDFITCLFSKERRSRVKPVAEFFLSVKSWCPRPKRFVLCTKFSLRRWASWAAWAQLKHAQNGFKLGNPTEANNLPRSAKTKTESSNVKRISGPTRRHDFCEHLIFPSVETFFLYIRGSIVF